MEKSSLSRPEATSMHTTRRLNMLKASSSRCHLGCQTNHWQTKMHSDSERRCTVSYDGSNFSRAANLLHSVRWCPKCGIAHPQLTRNRTKQSGTRRFEHILHA